MMNQVLTPFSYAFADDVDIFDVEENVTVAEENVSDWDVEDTEEVTNEDREPWYDTEVSDDETWEENEETWDTTDWDTWDDENSDDENTWDDNEWSNSWTWDIEQLTGDVLTGDVLTWDVNEEIDYSQYTNETRVAVLASKLWINWEEDAEYYAQLAWIIEDYWGTAEQNAVIRQFFLDHIEEILNGEYDEIISKMKAWEDVDLWNEWSETQTGSLLTWDVEILTGDVLTWNVLSGSVLTGDIFTGDIEELTWDILSWEVLTWYMTREELLEHMWDVLNEWVIRWQDTYNDVIVEVEAPIGSFPKGTQLRIVPITWSDQIEEIKNELVESYDMTGNLELVSFDISFVYVLSGDDVVKVQPYSWQKVKVTFNYAGSDKFSGADDEGRELKVYHIEDWDSEVRDSGVKKSKWKWNTKNMKEIKSKKHSKWRLEIDADSFSTYTIVTQLAASPIWTMSTWVEWVNFEKIVQQNPNDNTQCITIMDRNLWATSTTDAWLYYQWWNNYWFTQTTAQANYSTTQVTNASSYGPWEYYSTTFVRRTSWWWGSNENISWMNPMNDNLWWWEDDDSGNSYGQWYPNFTDRQWPCPEWWHVPSAYEWSLLNTYWNIDNSHWSNTTIASADWTSFRTDFNIPLNGYITYLGMNSGYGPTQTSYVYLYTSSPYNTTAALTMYGNNWFSSDSTNNTARAAWVRCFKNTYECPVPYLIQFVDYDWTPLQTGMVTAWDMPVYTGSTPERQPDAQYVYVFNGWTPEISTVTWPQVYTATYTAIDPSDKYLIQFVNYDGTILQSGMVTYGDIPNYTGSTPVRSSDWTNNYTFEWWTPWISVVTWPQVYTATYISSVIRSWQFDGWVKWTNYNEIIVTWNNGQCITLMDRNLWATSNNINSTDSYWYYFEWWNSYWFQAWTLSSSPNTTRQGIVANNVPSKFYSNTFYRWRASNRSTSYWFNSSTYGLNLWWWWSDTSSNNYGQWQTNFTDRRWPCPAWWHVPSAYEWSMVNTYLAAKGYQTTTSNGLVWIASANLTNVRNDLLIPLNGRIYSASNGGSTLSSEYNGSRAYLYTSSPYSYQYWMAAYGYNWFVFDHWNYTSYAYWVRCFKDTYTCPACTFNGQVIAHGDSVTAYSASTVPYGSSCSSVAETRTCNMGVLEWDSSYSYSTCRVEQPASCDLTNYGWGTLLHWDSVTVYSNSSETCPNTCTSWTITCNNGTLEWNTTYHNRSCSISPKTCNWYTLSSTWAHWIYSSCILETPSGNTCVQGATKYKLDGCEDGWHISGNSCVPNNYHVTINVSPSSTYGTVTSGYVTEINGAWISTNGSNLIIWTTTVTAISTSTQLTDNYTYEFSWWDTHLCWQTLTQDCTITAEFRRLSNYTVTFDANRWTIVPSQRVAYGHTATQPTTSFPWYTFWGWYSDSGFNNSFNFSTPITSDITLYAKWTYNLAFNDLNVYFVWSDGSINHTVLMDRNLWATAIYNQNYNNPNTASYGYYYQWWNNYWFIPWSINTRTTSIPYEVWSQYVPSKYASGEFVERTAAWWQGWEGVSSYDLWWRDGSVIDRQWPCPDGYHLPYSSEWENIYNYWDDANTITTNQWMQLASDLLLPFAGFISYNTPDVVRSEGADGRFWYSQMRTFLNVYQESIYPRDGVDSTFGHSVRCFKNTQTATMNVHPKGWTWAVIAFTWSVNNGKIVTLWSPSKANATF